VRGLKLDEGYDTTDWQFAPITGAWIETPICGDGINKLASHPSRVRGLKPLLAVLLKRL